MKAMTAPRLHMSAKVVMWWLCLSTNITQVWITLRYAVVGENFRRLEIIVCYGGELKHGFPDSKLWERFVRSGRQVIIISRVTKHRSMELMSIKGYMEGRDWHSTLPLYSELAAGCELWGPASRVFLSLTFQHTRTSHRQLQTDIVGENYNIQRECLLLTNIQVFWF